ncbi:hypothetical protein Poly41_46830 [Novipirellula artificiosorum]|uniref:Uncharacterized protein n=1 Tax=Novipirellula artificiosorum TaxID=2528016 RepID=A0A5C6DD39_9BACT|nr:hypothetical protein Poly41_46830 [Novipirellula artificiosorum]
MSLQTIGCLFSFLLRIAQSNGRQALLRSNLPRDNWARKGRVSAHPTEARGTQTRGFFGGMAPVSNDVLEKSPRRTVVRREPVAPLAHRRPGYPLSSCTSAELHSVSPGNCTIKQVKIAATSNDWTPERCLENLLRTLPPDEPEFLAGKGSNERVFPGFLFGLRDGMTLNTFFLP